MKLALDISYIITFFLTVITVLLGFLSYFLKRYLRKTDEKFVLIFQRIHEIDIRCITCANMKTIEKLLPIAEAKK